MGRAFGCARCSSRTRVADRGPMIVLPRLLPRRRRHADVIVRERLAPDETRPARVGTECTAPRLTPRARLRIIVVRLLAYPGNHADVIVRVALAPHESLRAG